MWNLMAQRKGDGKKKSRMWMNLTGRQPKKEDQVAGLLPATTGKMPSVLMK